MSASGSSRVAALATLAEGPAEELCDYLEEEERRWKWNAVSKCSLVPSSFLISRQHNNNSNSNGKFSVDSRILLGVLACPLCPVSVSSCFSAAHDDGAFPPRISLRDHIQIEMSSAQYIVQQYIAATGCTKLYTSLKNSYTMGKLKMLATEYETPSKVSRNLSRSAETGCFVLWQFMPDMWSVELVVGCNKVHAGSNGKIVWRQTPWLGSHAAKGPARPLRRAIQGLDPQTTARMFVNARCVGEKRIGEEDCFILKLAASPAALAERNDGSAEIIRHALFGYFNQKTGFLVYVEDSHLTRIESTGNDAVYWETTIETTIDHYKPVDGVMIAHSGRSVVTVFKFGGQFGMTSTKTRIEETWTIEEIVFNVPGLSMDFFIPPAEIRKGSASGDPSELTSGKFGNGKAWQNSLGKLK
jgi:hypothetical protein